MNKRDLVERAQRGDHDAFAALTRASIGRLDTAARLILRDPTAAEDAVQDAFMNAWQGLPGLRDPDRFDAWLHRLVGTACRRQLRRQRSRPIEVELDALIEPSGPDAYASGADRDELDRGFRRLTPEQRAVVVLHYYLGIPLPEAAATLRIPLGTAKSRLNRSVTALRAALEADARAGAPAKGELA